MASLRTRRTAFPSRSTSALGGLGLLRDLRLGGSRLDHAHGRVIERCGQGHSTLSSAATNSDASISAPIEKKSYDSAYDATGLPLQPFVVFV